MNDIEVQMRSYLEYCVRQKCLDKETLLEMPQSRNCFLP